MAPRAARATQDVGAAPVYKREKRDASVWGGPALCAPCARAPAAAALTREAQSRPPHHAHALAPTSPCCPFPAATAIRRCIIMSNSKHQAPRAIRGTAPEAGDAGNHQWIATNKSKPFKSRHVALEQWQGLCSTPATRDRGRGASVRAGAAAAAHSRPAQASVGGGCFKGRRRGWALGGCAPTLERYSVQGRQSCPMRMAAAGYARTQELMCHFLCAHPRSI